jgi:hypothetical protein
MLAAKAVVADAVLEDHISCSPTTNMVDGGSTAKVTLQFLVEAEDSTLTAAMDVACPATT